ncbi:MAG: nuclear transport factor 2 family protein [Pseudomonadota bacterium]
MRDAISEKIVTHTALLEANTRFYAAFRAGDMITMGELWAREGPVAVHHPASGHVSGRVAVLDSWRVILRSPPDVVCVVETLLEDDETWAVICTERLGPISLPMVNLFRQEDETWRMTYHGPAPAPHLRH